MSQSSPPSADLVFDTLFAYQRSAALKAALDRGTPAGDAYTFDELRDQLEQAGFADATSHSLPTPETVVIARAI
jgi:hypothetical protein